MVSPAPPVPSGPVGLEEAEGALVGHYPRLARLAYLTLPYGGSRGRRVLAAHAIVQRALPRGRSAGEGSRVPAQRHGEDDDAGYVYVRLKVVTAALAAARPRGRLGLPRPAHLLPLPRVWGLRLLPRSGGADEPALERALGELSAPARAAYALRGVDGLDDAAVRRLLEAAGAADPDAALAEAGAVEAPAGSRDGQVLLSPAFDPCSLQARPTDLLRRRQHVRAALAALVALIACAALLGLPGDWGPGDAAAPAYARNAFAEQALDPAKLARAGRDDWRRAARPDFSAWPARGGRIHDSALLGRALKVWARPSTAVRISTTPGTQAGPPAGPPQLLFAGDVDDAAVVLFHDGLRLVRYAEPKAARGAAALDFARTDGADAVSATAAVVDRVDGNVRYLTAPWVSGVSSRDLLRPGADAAPLRRTPDGVTAPVPSPATARSCKHWTGLEMRTRPDAGAGTTPHLLTDLGELTPARLTYGNPSLPPGDVAGGTARRQLAASACRLTTLRGLGVRTVNAWAFAGQRLPEAGGTASWLCARAETWRGRGSRVLAQFLPPAALASRGPRQPGAVAAQAADTPACGPREPAALAGVLWKSRAGHWYVVAAGSRQVASITATGGTPARAAGRFLAVRTHKGARARLNARLTDGSHLSALH